MAIMFMKTGLGTIAIIALLVPLIANSGTVTLTGTCGGSVQYGPSGNYLTFSIQNTGNDSAVSMVVTPEFSGFDTYNASVTQPILAPGNLFGYGFYLYNLSYPGTYPEAFLVNYGQGTSTFSAVFPCLVSLRNQTNSLLRIQNITQLSNGSIEATISNGYGFAINSTLLVFLPSTFQAKPSSQRLVVRGGSEKTVVFGVSSPSSITSTTMGITVSFLLNDTHYSYLSDYVFRTGGTQPQSPVQLPLPLPIIVIAVVVLILIVLIVVSIFKKR